MSDVFRLGMPGQNTATLLLPVAHEARNSALNAPEPPSYVA